VVQQVNESLESLLSQRDDPLPLPLLVLRLCELERIAWNRGRAAAIRVEQKCWRRFHRKAKALLRPADIVFHEPGSQDFVIVLAAPGRQGCPVSPMSCRSTLSRLASATLPAAEGRIATGWTFVPRVTSETLTGAVEEALDRGARERERYEFFSSVGHELRTPLTSVRGYIETLLHEKHNEEDRRKFLDVARNELLRMGRLLDSMFEISMLDLNSTNVATAAAPLATTLSEAITIVGPLAAVRGSCLALVCNTSCSVSIERDRLVQVAVNILENAVKHGRDRGRVSVRCTQPDNDTVDVWFDDDGPGIESAERVDVFELGRRGTNACAPGSGVGLAIVRRIIEHAGGSVEVAESNSGGASLRVRLRVAGTGWIDAGV
jgi:signal transduction histidine kinase